MSTRAFNPLDYLRTVRDSDKLDKHGKLVLMFLVTYANESGERCHPQVDTIARVSGFSRATVLRALKAIQDSGDWFTVTRASRTAVNCYTLRSKYPAATSQTATSQTATSHAATSPTDTCEVSGGHLRSIPQTPDLLIDLLNGSAQRDLVLTHDAPAAGSHNGTTKPRARKPAKHSQQEIADKGLVLAHFVEQFEQVKGCKPKSIDAADNAAAFRLATLYGPAEARAIIDRALLDPFVVNSNCCLRFIASKADTFRGAVKGTAKAKARNPVQDEGQGQAWESLARPGRVQ